MPSHRLFKLNSPPGWNTTKDHLSGRLLASDEPPFGLSWEDLTEEIIFVASSRCSLGIDLGWYPDYSPEGQFRIEVVDLDNLAATYAKPLREFATRSVWAAKQQMEEWMAELHALQDQSKAGPDGGPVTPQGNLGVTEEPGPDSPSPKAEPANPREVGITPRDQLIQDIENVFRDVERGNGLTLHEAAEFEGNDYGTAEERACVRAFDPETRWQDIPESSLEECEDRWAFDDEGFRFHLPAYMRWHLRKPPEQDQLRGGLLYFMLSPAGGTEAAGSWDVFTLEQKRVIARFLEFIASGSGPLAQDARLTWRSYWFKFSQSTPRESTPG